MIKCNSEYKKLCHEIDSYFQNSANIITKKRNTIKIINYNDKDIVVKSFKIPNFVNQFAYRFIRDSKAKRSYLNAKKLQELDISTPKPLGFIEKFTPLLKNSYYICEYFDYDFEIRDVLNDANFSDKEKILKSFVLFSYNLHQSGVYHIDYSPGNVLIKKDKDRYIFSIVDVNRMKFLKFNNELRFKNLSRFSATQEDTNFLALEYAKLSGIDLEFAKKRLTFYHNKHQEYLQRKKRLKLLKS